MQIPSSLPADFSVIRDGGLVPPALKRGFVAIGNFDGVHRGHQAVIEAARVQAHMIPQKSCVLVLTFEPHPRTFFKPDAPVFRLTPEEAKLRLFAANNLVDGAVVLQFDKALASLSAEDFVSKILVDWLGIAGVAVGHDFHFGKQRQGTPEFLIDAGKRYGFEVEIVQPLNDDGTPVSSGKIRDALQAGDLPRANDLLGYRWFVTGEVIHGEKRGRELGFPTANLRLDPTCRLRHGIYAVRAHVGGKSYDAVASFGRRPQFDNGAPLLEVFLFDFEGDLYGQEMTVEFAGFLRDEAKFGSLDALVAQMNRDSEQARALLRQAGNA
ncbi:MAG: bifunctional riboflavin kinase/FAD synthetase [Xanthobacteraceae bacterium]|nr:bifunctional riboflavin kinase/FAD synthetase [Xanthobacteraceae bacterium]MBX3535974.1 bifunctional riboflavin kinase/FAD synthetase [Xanthobacteraceae bacterium]MCW5673812.1 bifunctional riboflavin kinase/FAD synthetase [Xanthobacteraceae bacterium]MCW5678613.1 bifunctional riboflavin kinase/FAD synthetase [Xanthobacteraceae bacterium]